MQPARFKLHAEERTCSPVQRPNRRGQGTRQATSTANAHPNSFTPPGEGTRTSNQGGGFVTLMWLPPGLAN
jgi:hypothetical protein